MAMDVDRLRKRFVAWWEGLDVEDLPDPQGALSPDGELGDASERRPVHYEPITPQLASHLTIAQKLWGEGFVGPGHTDYILELVSQLGITREKSVAYVGIGLGGPARDICRETGAWISGYETRGDMIEPASEQNLMAGLARKVSVQHLDAAAPDIPTGKYHIAISRDDLHVVSDKARLFACLFEALRPGGGLLLSDYVATGEGDLDALERGAFSPFWGGAHLLGASTLSSLLQEAGFDLRVKKEITATYLDTVAASTVRWAEIMRLVEEGGMEGSDRTTFLTALATEAAVWTERLNALRDGRLAVYRFFALKPDSELT